MRIGSDGTGFVFRNTSGGARQLRDVQLAFTKARDRAALPATDDGPVVFHSATYRDLKAREPSRDPLVHVRDFARHSDLATTQGYVHKIDDEKITTAIGEALAAE